MEKQMLDEYVNNAEKYIADNIVTDEYRSVKEGRPSIDELIHWCQCGQKQLVLLTEEKYHCFACGRDFAVAEYTVCPECDTLYETEKCSTICVDCFEKHCEEE